MHRVLTIILTVRSIALTTFASAQQNQLVVGPNTNMVSGTTWPDGDPFLRQQNEPSLAFSSRIQRLQSLCLQGAFLAMDYCLTNRSFNSKKGGAYI